MLLQNLLAKTFINRELLELALPALRAAAADPSQRTLVGRVWAKLSDKLAFEQTVLQLLLELPADAQRVAAEGIAHEATSMVAQLYAAAIELAGTRGLRRMVSARHRFGLVQYSGTKDFNHEQIARFALDELYLAAATRALHRWRAPVTATTSDSHLLWGLFNLVAVAGTDGAVNALVSVWSNAAPDLRELMLRPRLAKAAKLAPARDTIARIASEPLESRPLPFSPTESMAADLPTHQPSSAKRIDPNLHLAIVHAMIGAGQVPAPPPAMTKGQGSATRKALLAMPVPANFLTSLTSLSWTAGPIQTTIDPSWGGETDAFHLADLKHITSLVALESLHLELMHPTIDLEPLRALSSLKQINITVPVADVQALRDLPNLVDLQVTADDADENLAVLASLRDRGVTIRCP